MTGPGASAAAGARAGRILITGIRLTPLLLAFKEPYHWAGRVDHGSPVVLVEVETDAGITGIGESVSSLAAEITTAAFRAVEPLLVGQPIHDVARLVDEARHLGTFNHMPWFADFVLAGFEMALWDAVGKAAAVSCSSPGGGITASSDTSPSSAARRSARPAGWS